MYLQVYYKHQAATATVAVVQAPAAVRAATVRVAVVRVVVVHARVFVGVRVVIRGAVAGHEGL